MKDNKPDPYWSYLSKEGYVFEPLHGNPDRLSTEDTLWNTKDEEEHQEELESIKACLPLLSLVQKKVLFLVGMRGKSFHTAAQELGISERKAKLRLNEARSIILKFHRKRCRNED